MINNIRWAFEKLIERLDWMDKPTKSATLEKVEAMRSFIGYPEWLAEPRQLEEYYSGVGIHCIRVCFLFWSKKKVSKKRTKQQE